MCDRYSSVHGYICQECFGELVVTRPESIKIFMESDKVDPLEAPTGVDYQYVFPIRRDPDV
jgi:hypothetical protein